MFRQIGVLALAAMLCACSSDPAPGSGQPDGTTIAAARDAQPDDPALASLYDRSCRSCHANKASGAPLTGDVAAWKRRFDVRGEDGLLASTRNGLGAMPARGMCPDCSDDQYRALINFMAGKAG